MSIDDSGTGGGVDPYPLSHDIRYQSFLNAVFQRLRFGHSFDSDSDGIGLLTIMRRLLALGCDWSLINEYDLSFYDLLYDTQDVSAKEIHTIANGLLTTLQRDAIEPFLNTIKQVLISPTCDISNDITRLISEYIHWPLHLNNEWQRVRALHFVIDSSIPDNIL
jgi:hypothetical protein